MFSQETKSFLLTYYGSSNEWGGSLSLRLSEQLAVLWIMRKMRWEDNMRRGTMKYEKDENM